MRLVASVIISCVILFSSVSAQALSYTTSAFVEWSFSGVQVGLAPGFVGFNDVSVVYNQQGDFALSLPVGGASLPGTGTAATNFTFPTPTNAAGSLSTTASLVGSGSADAGIGITFRARAAEVGLSTLTVNYRFQETGTVPLGTSLSAISQINLSSFLTPSFGLPLCTSVGNCSRFTRSAETVVHGDQSLNITHTITGTFTGSHFFDTIGSDTALIFSASSQVVPEPASLSLLGLGLAGLAALKRKTFSHS